MIKFKLFFLILLFLIAEFCIGVFIINKRSEQLKTCEKEIVVLQNKLQIITDRYNKSIHLSTTLLATAYTGDEQTATLEKPRAGWTVAISQDRLDLLGKKIYIKGFGVRKITDLMDKEHKNALDIFMNKKMARAFNPRYVEIAIID